MLRLAHIRHLAPGELFAITKPDPATASADDRAVEAALLTHGDTITTDSLADALGWPLGRLERALGALDRRLRPTGAQLCRTGWHRYRIQPNRRALPKPAWQHLDHAHLEHHGLTTATATWLCLLIRGMPPASKAWKGDESLRQLRQQQLIERNQPPFRLTADIRYRRWPHAATRRRSVRRGRRLAR
jgi:hypothetical protein